MITTAFTFAATVNVVEHVGARPVLVDRDRVVEALIGENIGAALHYTPIHQHSYYRKRYGYCPESFPHATFAGEQIFSLPLTPSMSMADAEDVIQAVLKVARAYAD